MVSSVNKEQQNLVTWALGFFACWQGNPHITIHPKIYQVPAISAALQVLFPLCQCPTLGIKRALSCGPISMVVIPNSDDLLFP